MVAEASAPLLKVRDLRVDLRGGPTPIPVLRGVDLSVGAGEIVGLVGESGSGKTLTALTVLRLLPPALHVAGGTVEFDGADLLALSPAQYRRSVGGGSP
jgi:ABC-type glutathione transport system ATPase component